MIFEPHAYQERAICNVIADPYHGLFMDPGLGKTACILEAFRRMRAACDVERALVIAPLRVCYTTWPDEQEKWSQFRDIRVVNLHQHDVADPPDGDVFLINPESIEKLFGGPVVQKTRPGSKRKYRVVWKSGPWKDWRGRPEMLTVDESTRFKRSTGRRMKVLRRYLGDFGRRTILTGTPIPNGIMDLHGQMLILDRGEALDDRITEYQKRWFDGRQVGPPSRRFMKYTPLDGAFEEVRDLIAPHITCMRAEDWLDMPELVRTEVPVKIPDQALELYETVKNHGVGWFEDGEDVLMDGTLVKLQQIASGILYSDDKCKRWHAVHKEKLDALEDLLAESGRPTLVAYWFRSEAEAIRQRIGKDTPVIGGGTKPAETARIQREWNAGKHPVILVQPQAGAHGLNMQEGSNAIVWFTLPWDLEMYDQLNRRLYRQGQKSDTVFVYHLVARDTYDSVVSGVLKRKDRKQSDLKAALVEEIHQ